MIKSQGYTGIDTFKIIAALLVVAIHTSPLTMASDMADFLLTRIIGRTAVPFFFMTSAFFLFSKGGINTERLKVFIKRTVLLYGVAMILYIPINIYTGYFTRDNLIPIIIKDMVFDGTFYHLWYLPASIIGAIIAWFLIKKNGYTQAIWMTLLLYGIGLLGDSYFGFAKEVPILNVFLGYVYQISDYTRNGLFFAPIFFVLGGMIANKRIRFSLKTNLIGLAVSTLLMTAEGLILHEWGLKRHDSMYIMLLPCMTFLFQTLLFWKGKRLSLLKNASMVIYIVHPMMIIVIRLFAKIFGWQELLVNNSVFHYIAVSVASIIAIIPVTVVLKRKNRKKQSELLEHDTDRAWIELDLNNLKHNVSVLQNMMPEGCDLMAVVKAEAYGHGAITISTCLNQVGVKSFAVATIDEGIELRKHGIEGEILILGYSDLTRAKQLKHYQLIQTISDHSYAKRLSAYGYDLKVHIKVDTGMHRLGIRAVETEKIAEIFGFEHLKICGIYTHLSVSDSLSESDIEFTQGQIADFYELLESLAQKGVKIPKTHIQSSYGFLNYPELRCNYARIGIALYGTLTALGDKTKLQPDIRPVLSLKAKITCIRVISEGESVGYGRTFTAERESRLAVLPIGYADGFPRNLSFAHCEVLINGHRVPIVGLICMDQLVVDITDVPSIQVGEIAILIGKDGEKEIYATEVAQKAGSITNELLSRIGNRLKKHVINS